MCFLTTIVWLEMQLQSLTNDLKSSMYVTLMLNEDYKYYGSKELHQKYYPILKQYVITYKTSKKRIT